MATKKLKTPIYYTYLIGWSHLDIWYYGSKYSVDADPELFWKNYWTSSKHVKRFREKHGEPDVIQIRRTFDCPYKTVAWEGKVHKRMGCRLSDRWINKADANNKCIAAGMVTVKDKSGNTLQVTVDDPRFLNGEFISIHKGRFLVQDVDGNKMKVTNDDPRLKTGELVSVNAGMMPAKDKNGNTMQVSVNDPRLKTGELIHASAGTTTVKDKNGNTMRVSVNDPRLKTGELVSITVGLISVKDKLGNSFKTTKNDPRWETGEIVGNRKKNWPPLG